jgi:hypothetical protein
MDGGRMGYDSLSGTIRHSAGATDETHVALDDTRNVYLQNTVQ